MPYEHEPAPYQPQGSFGFANVQYENQPVNSSVPPPQFRDPNITVYLLAANLETTKSITGVKTGTKLFMDSTAHPSSGTGTVIALPDIGDPYSVDAPELRVVRIRQGYLNDKSNCGKTYTVEYETKGSDNPIAMEIGSELVTFEPQAGTWKWRIQNTEIAGQPLFYMAQTATIKIQRKIYNLTQFMTASLNAAGRCNKALWRNIIPPWMVLYEGCTISEGVGENNVQGNAGRIWEAELSFKFRSVTGDYTFGVVGDDDTFTMGGNDGWNWAIVDKPTTEGVAWDKPYYWPDGTTDYKFLYDWTDFEILMTSGSNPIQQSNLGWMQGTP